MKDQSIQDKEDARLALAQFDGSFNAGCAIREISDAKKQTPINTDGIRIFQQDALQFLESLPENSVDLIVTDPAYSGMNQHLMLGKGRIVGKYQDKGNRGKWFEEFHDTPENYGRFLNACNRVLKQDRHFFVMFDAYSMLTLGEMVRDFFNVKNIIVWDKVNIGMGHYFRRQSEFILFACKGKRPLRRRDIPDVWRFKRLHGAQYPTQKPVELFEAMIASSKQKNDGEFLVCDPFMGSGSAAIASIRQGATFIGCDISDKAIAFAQNRIEVFLRDKIDTAQQKPAYDPEMQKKFW